MPTAGPISAVRSSAATSGRPGTCRPAGMSPTTAMPRSCRSKMYDDRRRAEHADQRHRCPRAEVAHGEQHGQRRQAERRGRPVHLVEVRRTPGAARRRTTSVLLDAEQLAELRGNHDDGDAGEVADQHGPRQQVGERAEPQHPADRAARRDHQRECGRERRPVVAGGRERPERRRRHQSRRRLRADRELPRRAEDDVHGQRRRSRPTDRCLGRYAGQLGVRHHLRDQVRRHRHAREQVAAQPAALVAAHPPRKGQAIYAKPRSRRTRSRSMSVGCGCSRCIHSKSSSRAFEVGASFGGGGAWRQAAESRNPLLEPPLFVGPGDRGEVGSGELWRSALWERGPEVMSNGTFETSINVASGSTSTKASCSDSESARATWRAG